MVAVYLCQTQEENILDMSYPFFNNILKFLNRKLNYEAAVGYAGNGFFKDSGELIRNSNPLANHENKILSYGEQMAALINTGTIKIEKSEEKDKMKGFMEEHGFKLE